jgi:hypothetical protein
MPMRALVQSLAIGRIAFGAVMLLKPEAAVRGWIGRRPASSAGTQAVTRAFGARDLVLGAGTLRALAQQTEARDWVAAGAFADVVDFAATATADEIPLVGRMLVLAMAGAAIGVSAGYLAGGSNERAQ